MSFLEVNGKSYKVADDVHFAVELIKQTYGAVQGFATNHEAPRVAYNFPRHGGAQVMIPLNKRDFSMVVRDTTRDGRSLSSLLPGSCITDTYPKDGNAGGSLMRGKVPYLKPTRDNTVIRVALARDELKRVLDMYLAAPQPRNASAEPEGVDTLAVSGNIPSVINNRPGLSLDAFLAQLDRNSETGQTGEKVAIAYETDRLREARCPDPAAFIRHVALTDVGRGYDIDSTWPGHERCIEVKSTTRQGSDIYLSANELEVLEKLGDKAWLYRVLVKADGSGVVIGKPLKNPVPALKAAGMTTAVWRAPDPVASARQNDE